VSKPKINNLAAALNKQAKGPDVEPVVSERRASPAPKQKQHSAAGTRQGRVMVSGWLPIEARSSFRLIQAKHPDKKMQDLVTEAMNDLFAKYNVPQTANGNQ
jgi:hypothetical protein